MCTLASHFCFVSTADFLLLAISGSCLIALDLTSDESRARVHGELTERIVENLTPNTSPKLKRKEKKNRGYDEQLRIQLLDDISRILRELMTNRLPPQANLHIHHPTGGNPFALLAQSPSNLPFGTFVKVFFTT